MATSAWILVLALIGAIVVIRTSYAVLDFLAFHFLTPSRPLKRYKRAGAEHTFALVTGASAGIGLGVAQALAKQGFGVILLGHLVDELAEARASLLALAPHAAVRIIVMDVRTATPAEIEAAVRSITDLQVSILVNNVGSVPIELPPIRLLATYSSADIDTTIAMNARFMARLTALMLPLLSRRAGPGERSLIITTSSLAYVGQPWLVVYGATKAFNLSFSRGLARELGADPATRHVDCLAIVPGSVKTQANSVGVAEHEPNWDYFGQCIVNKTDGALQRGMRDMYPHWRHGVEATVLAALSESARTNGLADLMRKIKDDTDAVYKKRQ